MYFASTLFLSTVTALAACAVRSGSCGVLLSGLSPGISEAPRGILYHRYKVGADGLIQFAKITPPTAQNYARMEADLWQLAPTVINRPHKEASLACEHLIRSYDPCISCSTHFLKLHIDEQK